MTTLQGFVPVGEVTADERARVAVGKAGAHKNDRCSVGSPKPPKALDWVTAEGDEDADDL